MAYQVFLKPSAERDLASLPRRVALRIDTRLRALGQNPRPEGAVKLQGEEDLYRVRVGDYRILYAIRDDRLIILIIRVGHRSHVYR